MFANIPYTVHHNLASRDVKEDFFGEDPKTMGLYEETSFDKGLVKIQKTAQFVTLIDVAAAMFATKSATKQECKQTLSSDHAGIAPLHEKQFLSY